MEDVRPMLIVRDSYTDQNVLGSLFMGAEHVYYTLERPWLNNRRSVSCIPVGEYKGAVQYSPRFKALLPELLDVPGRSQILIHAGNTEADTQGCILLGMGRDDVARTIQSSRVAVGKLLASRVRAREAARASLEIDLGETAQPGADTPR